MLIYQMEWPHPQGVVPMGLPHPLLGPLGAPPQVAARGLCAGSGLRPRALPPGGHTRASVTPFNNGLLSGTCRPVLQAPGIGSEPEQYGEQSCSVTFHW